MISIYKNDENMTEYFETSVVIRIIFENEEHTFSGKAEHVFPERSALA
jgi:hypothetical protein